MTITHHPQPVAYYPVHRTVIGSTPVPESRSFVASGGRVSTFLPPERSRDELVEDLIASSSKNRLYERILRDIQRHYGDEPNVGYIAVLTSRIETLEANVVKLSRRNAA